MWFDDTSGRDDTQPPPDDVLDAKDREILVLRLELQWVERERDQALGACERAGVNPWAALIRPNLVSNEDAIAVHNAQHPQCGADGFGLITEEVEIPTAEEIERAEADAIPVAVWQGGQP